MFSPQLHIPQQKAVSDNYQGVRPDEISIQNWLNKRDHMDQQEFLDTLAKLNRIQCDPAKRMSIMAILDVEIEKELNRLYKKTDGIVFPINEEYQLLINTLQQLLLESSVAYQIALHDIALNEDYVSHYLGSLIPESLYMSLFYLSRLLVERFEFYLSEPAGIWQDLNQLYLLAERIGAQDDVIRRQASIKNIYLKISIFKILGPYRLMSLEARKIYHLMTDWIEHCEISGYAGHTLDNKFVVNLLSDKSPHYFNQENDRQESRATQFEGRIVSVDKLRIFLDAYLAKMDEQKQEHALSYQARRHNEILQRINNEITVHEARSEERQLIGHEIKLVSGFRACHHFISNRKPFAPQAEIDAQLEQKLRENQPENDSDINLISLLEEAKLLNKKHPMGELQSVNPFLGESEMLGDEWQHIYADSVINVNMHDSEELLSRNLKEENWKQKNESAHGMLLVGKNDIEMPIGVGMLVAYRLNVEKAYCLGAVKWLRINPHKGMAVGLQLLAVQSRAIAVKGGQGAGGEYQRAFLISENTSGVKSEKLQLLVPAGVYDTGSILKVWHNDKLSEVTISQILLATDSFARVAFEVVPDLAKS